jgi:hypothetical protein
VAVQGSTANVLRVPGCSYSDADRPTSRGNRVRAFCRTRLASDLRSTYQFLAWPSRRGSPKEIALAKLHAQRGESQALGIGFDTLGDDPEANGGGEVKHACNQSLPNRVAADTAHQSAVELHARRSKLDDASSGPFARREALCLMKTGR